MNYVLAILLIGFLILVHELGHFLVARVVKIPIARFSVGFGPRLFGFRRGETEYWLSAFPLGGYVLPAIEDQDQFFRMPATRRLAFFVGGPLANLLLVAERLCPRVRRLQIALSVVGLFLLLGLMAYATAMDIARYLFC